MAQASSRTRDEATAARLEELEVALKELDVAQKRKELASACINWTVAGPVIVTVIAGLIGLLQTTNSNNQTAKAQRAIEELKAKNELIIEAVKTGADHPEVASDNIKFFLDAGLIDDPEGRIRKLIDERRSPVLPAATSLSLPTECPFDATKLTLGDLLQRLEGQQVPDATIQDLRKQISAITTTALSDKQRDGLAALAYNIGIPRLKSSTLVTMIDAGDFQGAAAAFLRLNKPLGMPGLAARRLCERDFFLAGIP
jgi:hypothetical protein